MKFSFNFQVFGLFNFVFLWMQWVFICAPEIIKKQRNGTLLTKTNSQVPVLSLWIFRTQFSIFPFWMFYCVMKMIRREKRKKENKLEINCFRQTINNEHWTRNIFHMKSHLKNQMKTHLSLNVDDSFWIFVLDVEWISSSKTSPILGIGINCQISSKKMTRKIKTV